MKLSFFLFYPKKKKKIKRKRDFLVPMSGVMGPTSSFGLHPSIYFLYGPSDHIVKEREREVVCPLDP